MLEINIYIYLIGLIPAYLIGRKLSINYPFERTYGDVLLNCAMALMWPTYLGVGVFGFFIVIFILMTISDWFSNRNIKPPKWM